MFQTPAIVKSVVGASLAAVFWGNQFAPRTCTGPNCRNGQCSRAASVVVPVTQPVAYFQSAPQIFTPDSEAMVWVDLPYDGEPELIKSPIATDVQAEVEQLDEEQPDAEEQAESQEAADEGPEDRPSAKAAAGAGDAKKAPRTAKTQRVRMRASDAAAMGLVPRVSEATGHGSSGGGAGATVSSNVAYRTVTTYVEPVVTTCNCGGSYMGGGAAAVNYRVQQQQFWAPRQTYVTRRVLFPNLFPRLRGLR